MVGRPDTRARPRLRAGALTLSAASALVASPAAAFPTDPNEAKTYDTERATPPRTIGVSEGPRRPETPTRARTSGAARLTPTAPAGPAELPVSTADELELKRQSDGDYLYVDPGLNFTARFNNDGTVDFADRWKRPDGRSHDHGRCCALPPGFGIGTAMQTTGPTEWVMWLAGMDPGARLKAELLKKTLPMRVRLAVEWNLELLAQRFAELDEDLYAVWSRDDVSHERRRELLFQLWDDCDEAFELEPGDVPGEALSVIDEARKHTAERARRAIEAFIRRQLPRGSGRRFTADELRRYNAQRVSQQTFDPYTPRAEPPPLKRERGTPWAETRAPSE
ncbi:MAG: hypothetical protein H6713_40980 [Myxococcales bacterium]|nr:hypothetical protein [Myxococcales bacterium]